MKLRPLIACLPAMTLTAGCAGTQYSFKEFSPQDGQPKTALIDIKQRAILSGTKPDGKALVLCAEPSPDALSSLSSQFALDANLKDALAATLSAAQQEAASFVGLRTQTIQLLRDSMYRLCEGYLAGALTQADFSWLSRRYQKYMVALLTIEQLTRVAQAPTVAHSASGLASASRAATAIQRDIEAIDKDLTRLGSEKEKLATQKAEAEKLPKEDATRETKIAAATKALDENAAATKRTGEVRSALLEGLSSAKGLLASGQATVQVVASTQENRPAASAEVTAAIAGITQAVLNQDDLGQLCFQVLDGSRGNGTVDAHMKTHCADIIKTRAMSDESEVQLRRTEVQARIEILKKIPALMEQATKNGTTGIAALVNVLMVTGTRAQGAAAAPLTAPPPTAPNPGVRSVFGAPLQSSTTFMMRLDDTRFEKLERALRETEAKKTPRK
jgi:hypothetical protein